MPELTLTPIAARVQWRANEEAGPADWPQIVRRFVEEVARRVVGFHPAPMPRVRRRSGKRKT